MSTVETEVELNADGGPVFRAFDQIEARMKGIQGMVDQIVGRAKAAAEAFGGANLKTVRDLEKVIGQLEKFEKTVRKNDPAVQTDKSWEQRKKQLDDEAKARRRMADEVDAAYAETARKQRIAEDKKNREMESAMARRERQQMSAEQRKQRLADQRARTEIASFEREQRAREQAIKKEAQLREQNRFKNGRDNMRQEIENAKTLGELEAQRSKGIANLQQARGLVGKVGADEERQLHQIIAQERERVRLADSYIKAIRQPTSNATINRGLNVDEAKINAKNDMQTVTSLGAAKRMQAQAEADILRQIKAARTLEGEALKDAKNALDMDKARLAEIRKRVSELQREENARIASAKREKAAAEKEANKPPPGGGSVPPKGRGTLGTLGSIIGRTAAYGGAAAAIYGTISAIRDGVAAAINYEDELGKIGAVAGLTAGQQEKLSESIRLVAANSRFATEDIEAATMTLAQAGFSASDIGKSLQHISDLAAAAGVDFQQATDVVTSAIGAFQLQTSETGHIADVLSGALNTTKLNIQQVGLGLQYAGATAYENKLSFDELTASMATMAQAGIKSGSTIGTGLRQFLVDLQTPTKKMADEFKRLGISMEDIDVKSLGLPEVLHRLSDAGFGSASAYGTLETRAAAAYLVLKNNQGLLNEQIELQNQLGASADAAAKSQNSLSAEWQRFKNNINEKVADNSGGILDWFRQILHSANALSEDGTLRKMKQDLDGLKEGSPEWGKKAKEIQEYEENLYAASEAEGANADAIDKANTAVNESTEKYDEHVQAIQSTTEAIVRLQQREETLKKEKGALNAETASLMQRFEGLAGQLVGLANNYDNLLAAMRRVRAEQISFGALEASNRYVNLQTAHQAELGRANAFAGNLKSSGLFDRLPNNIRLQIEQIARNQNDPNAGKIVQSLFDYASRNLKGGDQKTLQGYAKSVSRLGINNQQVRQAKNDVDVMTHLGSKKGQELFNQIDNMPNMSEAEQKKFLGMLEANANNPGKSASVQGAYQQLAQLAQSQMGAGQPPRAPADKPKRGSNRAEHAQDRRNAALAGLRVKASEADLAQAIKGLLDLGFSQTTGPDGDEILTKEKTLTPERFSKNLDRVNDSLDKWANDRVKQVEAQIDSTDMDPNGEQAKLMREEVQREVKAKREDTARKVVDAIVDAMDVAVDAVENIKEQAEMAADQQVAIAEARVASLSRSNMEGRVPDYVVANAQRAAERAHDDRDQAQVGINLAEIDGLSKALESARLKLDETKDAFGNLTAGSADAQTKVTELETKIQGLTLANEALRVSLNGDALLPTSIAQAWGMVVENWQHANAAAGDLGQTILNNLGGALDTVQGSMEEMVSGVLNGTMTMREAFRGMVQSIIQYLVKLIAKMLVVKVMQMALGAFAPGAGAGATGIPGVNTDPGAVLFGLGKFYGGTAFTGRYVQKGVPSRDSVHMKVAKGEYIVRKSAVDSVGVDFMDRLNERGASALKGMAPKMIAAPSVEQKMNVYVVAPEHQPTMGPNDVLVTIANDIYRGGPTKQLIKQVAQGA